MQTDRITSSYFVSLLTLVLTIGAIGLAGCTTMSIPIKPLPPGTDLENEFPKIESQLSAAKENDVDYLSATHYAKAEAALNQAREQSIQGASYNEIAEKLAEAQSFLAHAENRAAIARGLLKDTREARANAIAVDAEQYFPKILEKADTKLLAMALLIEEGETPFSQSDNAELVDIYKRLEISSARICFLRAPQKILGDALNLGAAQWAPKTLQKAKATLAALDRQIHLNCRDTERVQILSARANRETDLLFRVTQQSKLIQSGNPEEIALRNETIKTLQSYFPPGEATVTLEGDRFGIQLKGLFQENATVIIPERVSLLEKAKQVQAEFEEPISIACEERANTPVLLQLERAKVVQEFLTQS
ncbi:hypothetical protein WDW86_22445 [Bdellovibrionota bacterium FG-2]